MSFLFSHSRLLLPAAALLAMQATAAEPKSEGLTAAQILERLAKTYSSSQTYRDTGVVTTVYIEADGKRSVERPFTTAFIRPDRLRFEYRDKIINNKERHYIIWTAAGQIQTWWDVTPGVKKPKSLARALAGAKLVSGGSAHTVPALLLPNEVIGTRLTDLSDGTRLPDDKLDALDCFRIQGKLDETSVTLWIDNAAGLLRRLDSTEKFEKFRTETTTTYDPVINAEVPAKLLDFNPPK